MTNAAKTLTHPAPGDTLANGATVISYTHKHDGDVATMPYGVILAMRPGVRHDPYVVWSLCAFQASDGVWYCGGGHYFTNLGDALNMFADLGGKLY
jgi:hypothetical protein